MTAAILAAACALLAAAAALPAAANDVRSPAATGRIDGQIVLSPAFPAARAGEPNQRGIPGQVAVVDSAGAAVAQVAADRDGRFQVDLAPGHYTLRLTSQRWPGSSAPVSVTVERGKATSAVVTYDSGIR